jgi:hypothetical protein
VTAVLPHHDATLGDDEVRPLGYTRDADGYWQRPVADAERYGAAPTRMRVTDDEALMRAFLDAHDGDLQAATVDWQAVRKETDDQFHRDLEAARTWEPKVKLGPLTAEERKQLARILAAEKPTAGAVKRRRDDAEKGRSYALAALEGEAEAVASAPKGLRNETLNSSAWTLARPELDGILDADEIERVLTAAAQDAGLHSREARATIRGAFRRRKRL